MSFQTAPLFLVKNQHNQIGTSIPTVRNSQKYETQSHKFSINYTVYNALTETTEAVKNQVTARRPHAISPAWIFHSTDQTQSSSGTRGLHPIYTREHRPWVSTAVSP